MLIGRANVSVRPPADFAMRNKKILICISHVMYFQEGSTTPSTDSHDESRDLPMD
jgi:hypothetical protein